MKIIIGLSIALAFFAVWFMKVRLKGYSKKDVTLKMLAAVCFVAISMVAFCMNPSELGRYLLFGADFGALGDLFLGLSHIDKDNKKRHMFLGILGFGIGHIFYCVGLLIEYASIDNLPYTLPPLGIGILIAVIVGVFGRKMGLHFGRLLPAVCVYVFLLSFSVVQALFLNIYHGFENTQLLLFGMGITLFIVSDSILARMYFGKQKHPALNVITNHVTYYLAQWLIALSILFL
ncbi:MAG: lysoplasmalogenase [Lachnospiraceae bacterium]|nr:lysoplasmalogenase [Lachnospiraceae bacterium]